jgi:hypothetical protein
MVRACRINQHHVLSLSCPDSFHLNALYINQSAGKIWHKVADAWRLMTNLHQQSTCGMRDDPTMKGLLGLSRQKQFEGNSYSPHVDKPAYIKVLTGYQ